MGKFCASCGQPADETRPFCGSCGAPTGGKETEAKPALDPFGETPPAPAAQSSAAAAQNVLKKRAVIKLATACAIFISIALCFGLSFTHVISAGFGFGFTAITILTEYIPLMSLAGMPVSVKVLNILWAAIGLSISVLGLIFMIVQTIKVFKAVSLFKAKKFAELSELKAGEGLLAALGAVGAAGFISIVDGIGPAIMIPFIVPLAVLLLSAAVRLFLWGGKTDGQRIKSFLGTASLFVISLMLVFFVKLPVFSMEGVNLNLHQSMISFLSFNFGGEDPMASIKLVVIGAESAVTLVYAIIMIPMVYGLTLSDVSKLESTRRNGRQVLSGLITVALFVLVLGILPIAWPPAFGKMGAGGIVCFIFALAGTILHCALVKKGTKNQPLLANAPLNLSTGVPNSSI